jgi:hypothetical protein
MFAESAGSHAWRRSARAELALVPRPPGGRAGVCTGGRWGGPAAGPPAGLGAAGAGAAPGLGWAGLGWAGLGFLAGVARLHERPRSARSSASPPLQGADAEVPPPAATAAAAAAGVAAQPEEGPEEEGPKEEEPKEEGPEEEGPEEEEPEEEGGLRRRSPRRRGLRRSPRRRSPRRRSLKRRSLRRSPRRRSPRRRSPKRRSLRRGRGVPAPSPTRCGGGARRHQPGRAGPRWRSHAATATSSSGGRSRRAGARAGGRAAVWLAMAAQRRPPASGCTRILQLAPPRRAATGLLHLATSLCRGFRTSYWCKTHHTPEWREGPRDPGRFATPVASVHFAKMAMKASATAQVRTAAAAALNGASPPPPP